MTSDDSGESSGGALLMRMKCDVAQRDRMLLSVQYLARDERAHTLEPHAGFELGLLRTSSQRENHVSRGATSSWRTPNASSTVATRSSRKGAGDGARWISAASGARRSR